MLSRPTMGTSYPEIVTTKTGNHRRRFYLEEMGETSAISRSLASKQPLQASSYCFRKERTDDDRLGLEAL